MYSITVLYSPDQCPLNETLHANVGVKLPKRLYNNKNIKLPQAVANAADSICDCPVPALKE